jgi:hypothetical protein
MALALWRARESLQLVEKWKQSPEVRNAKEGVPLQPKKRSRDQAEERESRLG